jgi:hypothetical protein
MAPGFLDVILTILNFPKKVLFHKFGSKNTQKAEQLASKYNE